MALTTLTERERRFIEAYMGEAAGNGAKAAIVAGYAAGSAKVTASKLLTKPNVKQAFLERRDLVSNASIATEKERRELLTMMARDAEMHPLARLKGVDILNKMDGLYVVRQEHTGAEGGPIQHRVVFVKPERHAD